MNKQELDIKSFQSIFREVLEGKSFRNIEKEYGVNRELVVEKIKEMFPKNSIEAEKIKQIIEYNKKKTLEKLISKEQLEEICKKIFNNEMKKEMACNVLGIDILTLNEKIIKYVCNCDDIELKRGYIEYEAKIHPDYSYINFKALILEMAKRTASQLKMAEEYGIPARRISREVERLKDDIYYNDLYEICKECADRNMHRQSFSTFEKDLIDKVLSKYDEGSIIIENIETKEETEYRRAKDIVQLADFCSGSNSEKAKTAGISISTLRRMRNLIKNYEEKQKMKKEISREE